MTHTPTPLRKNELGHVIGPDNKIVIVTGFAFNNRFPNRLAKITTDRILATYNFFHGRDIPTERIAEGGFWEMVSFLKRANLSLKLNAPMQAETLTKELNALLTKLGVEP